MDKKQKEASVIALSEKGRTYREITKETQENCQLKTSL